ncbi:MULTISPECIES: hypothetical protein [unclassified Pseudomonas]|uniref:hypothetical protein n=1 Tax=unclassified Pseudomonas TaxID=196821 RepID=UPI0012FDB2BE|nr:MULTISPECIES: hypothetical protein [unclassified Pseudomonas]MCU1739577.1 hypothetical protein [Pseudomonas sp. 20S_6.2_Bac1]
MNTNTMIVCDTCGAETHCRIGMSNRRFQPLSFLCEGCGVAIEIDIKDMVGTALRNAKEIPFERDSLEQKKRFFIDLHLDFPIWSQTYVMGKTPYLVACGMVDKDKIHINGVPAVEIFRIRLDFLNYFGERFNEVKQLLKLYPRNNKELFRKKAIEFLEGEHTNSLAPQDINALLYTVLSRVSLAFLEQETVREVAGRYPEIIIHLAQTRREKFDEFYRYIKETGFLNGLQRDCLSLYGRIFELELYLRPAIFLDFCTGQESKKSSAKISKLGFDSCKDMYKDLSEIVGRQLALVAGINNLIHRGDHNSFLPSKDGPALSSLDKFANKVLSEKLKYLDDCWYKLDEGLLDTDIRNSIAHYTFEYDDSTQMITCYPSKEGLRQENKVEINFLNFMRMILIQFREMHYLHHLIKALYYYEYLIINK